MKKVALLLAAAMLAIPLAGCSQDEGADGGKETIKIGGRMRVCGRYRGGFGGRTGGEYGGERRGGGQHRSGAAG